MTTTTSLEAYLSSMDKEDLSLIQLVYCVPNEFKLVLPGLGVLANDLPPSHLAMYEKALKARLRFSLLFFVIKVLYFFEISLCILNPTPSGTS